VTGRHKCSSKTKLPKIKKQMLQQQQVIHQYNQDVLDMQAGEYNKNRQHEQEAEQRHAEVLQRIHAIERIRARQNSKKMQ